MLASIFSMLDKDNKERFSKKNFLLADINLRIVFQMCFLTMNNLNVDVQAWDLQWRSYTNGVVLPSIKKVELIEKKIFAAGILDPEHEVFIVYVATLSINLDNEIHPSNKTPIAHLEADKAPIKVPGEDANFAELSLSKLATELSKHIVINDDVIELVYN